MFGWILGGYNVLGAGAGLTRTCAELPAHDQVRVQLEFVKIDSWGFYTWGRVRLALLLQRAGQHCCGLRRPSPRQ